MGGYFLEGIKKDIKKRMWESIEERVGLSDDILELLSKNNALDKYKNIFDVMEIDVTEKSELKKLFNKCYSSSTELATTISLIISAKFNTSTEQKTALIKEPGDIGKSLIALSKYLKTFKLKKKKLPNNLNEAVIVGLAISQGFSFLSELKILQHNGN